MTTVAGPPMPVGSIPGCLCATLFGRSTLTLSHSAFAAAFFRCHSYPQKLAPVTALFLCYFRYGNGLPLTVYVLDSYDTSLQALHAKTMLSVISWRLVHSSEAVGPVSLPAPAVYYASGNLTDL